MARSANRTGDDGHLAVEVLAEGGSDYIRNKVLKTALETEQNMIAKGLPVQPPTPPDAHVCADSLRDESGLIRVPLQPQRKGGDTAVIGHVFLQPSTGDVVRIAGRLAKNPSFWISQVDVEWLYARVDQRHRHAGCAVLDGQGQDVRSVNVPHDLRLCEH